jgi:hypothetical protein
MHKKFDCLNDLTQISPIVWNVKHERLNDICGGGKSLHAAVMASPETQSEVMNQRKTKADNTYI